MKLLPLATLEHGSSAVRRNVPSTCLSTCPLIDYCCTGMAIRLALTLGLHTSTHRYVEEGKMTAAEANARNVTMWGSFLNDW